MQAKRTSGVKFPISKIREKVDMLVDDKTPILYIHML